MRHIAICLSAFFLASPFASAQSFIGAGGISCSEVIKLPKGSTTRNQVDGYAQGYVSGMAAAVYVQSNSKQDILRPVAAKEVLQFVDFYCGENGTKTLLNAANAYLTYLGRNLGR